MKRAFILITCVILAAATGQAELMGDINDYLPHMGAGQPGEGGDLFTFDSIDDFDENGVGWVLNGGSYSETNGQGIITLQGLEFNPDPLVTGTVQIENTTGTEQTYVYHFTQPAVLNTASSIVRGDIAITLLNRGALDGASFKDNNTAVYKAYVDGDLVETLLDPTYDLSGPLGNADDAAFGWQAYGSSVTNDISIVVEFNLSPGDSATVLTSFEIIPEPGTLMLAGLTTLGIVFVRRRFVD